mmetsp:Transcript_10546/g.14228  ORF Transcript_10546/g.14228 Transcript_10546/m.14228 type:complete len:194 (+) Transcript_10546:787-1368(+)
MNIVTVLFMGCLFVTVVALVFCIRYTIMQCCPSFCLKITRKIERKLFWNSLLRACLETYYSTSVFFFFAMGSTQANDQEGRIELLTWLAMGTFLITFPFVTFRILFNRWGTIHKAEVRERFDSLYQNVEVYKGPIAFAFSLYFCLRRLAFAYVIGQVHTTIVYQIFLMDIVSTLMLCYFITIQPMVDHINNAI